MGRGSCGQPGGDAKPRGLVAGRAPRQPCPLRRPGLLPVHVSCFVALCLSADFRVEPKLVFGENIFLIQSCYQKF